MLAYLIRHSESQANARLHDGLNAPVTPLGIAQAEALVKRLSAVKASAIYSSPFRRCLETAAPIAKALGLQIRLRRELCEYHHLPEGTDRDLELDDLDSIAREFAGAAMCPDCDKSLPWPPVDEPLRGMLERVAAMASYLKARWSSPSDVVVVISHGSPVARLIESWLSPDPGPSFRFVIDNAAVSALRYHNGVSSLVCLNEVSHLRGLPVPALANYCEDGSIKVEPAAPAW
jgi:probable phosphoglycerate mutase